MARALDPELLAEARRIQLRADRMVTDVMSGGYSSVFRGSGIEFDEVREFAEGDELRSVDWNVTARVGRPFVKKFVEERELSVLFLLDVSSSMAFGTQPGASRHGPDQRTVSQRTVSQRTVSQRTVTQRTVSQRTVSQRTVSQRTVTSTAAMFVGCVAFAAARNNDKAGLITFAEDIERYVPAKKGRNHVLRLIREACEPPQKNRGSNFKKALDYAGRVQRRHAIVFVVSDFLGADCERELRLLSRRHEVIAVRLRDPFAAGLDAAGGDVAALPNAGLLHLVDPETNASIVVDTTSRRVRDELRRRWQEERLGFRDVCRRCGVDLLDVPTIGSVANPLLQFFRMREKRGRRR